MTGSRLLPLGAMLLAGSLGTAALAQTPPDAPVAGTLSAVAVRDSAPAGGIGLPTVVLGI
ncbi:hypothetical protein [Ottowia testudinis]|uniref:Uncharacterized protein n=1 Tax=Ottowia testudinis TaxID=2816950 RepID=A0A975CJN8_9BURK|nr:hypothetical protein [Ottowia testudinis]QTD46316.1 hypothetical protein J1M35_05325 [Ottowia testudinis]